MQSSRVFRWSTAAAAAAIAAFFSTAPGSALSVSGQARAVQASVIGIGTATLADTGSLGGPTDAREASLNAGSIPSVITASALHATTIGWADQAASEASVGNLNLTVGGVTIGADFVMARIHSAGNTDTATAAIEGLTLDGVPVAVTGARNQRVDLIGGALLINEQRKNASGTVVNALHLTLDGIADVIVANATANAK